MSTGVSRAAESATVLLAAVKRISPLIREHAAEAERDRKLSPAVVDAMREAGLFRMWVPEAYGGLELDAVSAFRVVEAVSRIDSAAGWNLQLSVSCTALYCWFRNETPAEVFRGGPDQVIAGAFSPPAKVTPVEGGYRLNGHWQFGSGCQFCSWYIGPAVVMEGDKPRLGDRGEPVQVMITFQAKDIETPDTWHTLGMRGTGSHDFIARDLFIPERWATPLVPLTDFGPAYQGPLYRLSLWPSVAMLSSPALGAARAAIDELVELAGRKTPQYMGSKLGERPVVQAQIAKAEATLNAGRAYLHEVFTGLWEAARAGHRMTMDQKISAQLATTYAIDSAARAVDLVHASAGATAIREEHRFQRHFRDVHTMTQHAFASASRYESVGKLMFGIQTDWPFFAL